MGGEGYKGKQHVKVDSKKALTCIPHTRTPNALLVVRSHFLRWLFFFASVASIPYCLVPIFRSSTHECFKRPVRSSIRMKWFWRVTVGSGPGCSMGICGS